MLMASQRLDRLHEKCSQGKSGPEIHPAMMDALQVVEEILATCSYNLADQAEVRHNKVVSVYGKAILTAFTALQRTWTEGPVGGFPNPEPWLDKCELLQIAALATGFDIITCVSLGRAPESATIGLLHFAAAGLANPFFERHQKKAEPTQYCAYLITGLLERWLTGGHSLHGGQRGPPWMALGPMPPSAWARRAGR